MRIGIDLMGCDTPPAQLYEAVLHAAELFNASYTLIVFATEGAFRELARAQNLIHQSPQKAHIQFHIVKESIAMEDEPLKAVRRKKNSSLVAGIRHMKKRLLDGFITAGNTGALIASVTLSLPLLPGIYRPALLANLPSTKGSVAIIDVGGNVSYKARNLIQFAQMGAAYQRCSRGIEKPSVGLLNIGAESKKGTKEHQQAYQWLDENRSDHLSFYGNIEGREIFQGVVDVIVTDGFTGNILLKSIEGASSFILENIGRAYKTVEGVQQAVAEMHKKFHYTEYPGAILCGVDGVVVKCHGNSSAIAFLNGIKGAVRMVQLQLVHKIKQQLLSRPHADSPFSIE